MLILKKNIILIYNYLLLIVLFFMESLLFIKIEIYVFILSFLYILYYLWTKLFVIYFKVKNVVQPVKIENKKTALNKVKLNNKTKKSNQKVSKNIKISDENKTKVIDILKRVKSNSSKGYFDISKNLIVEWLSLDKYNKELNLELALIYEKEKNYLNAEYIYKDLLDFLKVDFVVMKKLGYIYALQNKLKDSLKIYEKIHTKKMSDDEVINILSELTFDMKLFKKSLKFSNLYLVWKPRDVEKLFIKAKSMEKLLKIKESILVYKRILELQPYNTKAKKHLAKVEKLNFVEE